MKKNISNKSDIDTTLNQLEEIINKMRNSQTGLDDALTLYSEGTRLAAECKRQLDDAKLKIEQCSGENIL